MRSNRSRGTSLPMVASMPIFAVTGILPGVGGRLGSSGFDRAPEMISTLLPITKPVADAATPE